MIMNFGPIGSMEKKKKAYSFQYDWGEEVQNDTGYAYLSFHYDGEYDPTTDETTLTFSNGYYQYTGRNGYTTSAETAITVTALDEGGNAQTATMRFDGQTTGGYGRFDSGIQPSSVKISHSGAVQGVKITTSSTIKFYQNTTSTQRQITLTGSEQKQELYP